MREILVDSMREDPMAMVLDMAMVLLRHHTEWVELRHHALSNHSRILIRVLHMMRETTDSLMIWDSEEVSTEVVTDGKRINIPAVL
jgi:hypothetical protein